MTVICKAGSVVNYGSQAGTVHSLRCKRWSCEACAERNRFQVMVKAREGKPNLFMTLTCKPDQYTCPEEAARDMKRGLVALRRRIERRWGVKNIPFIVVFERTKKGWPHMHLLLRAPYMHWKVLRAMWQDINGAHQVDVRFIKKASQVLFYVTKYIGKALHAFEGCKRWWRSHNYSTEEKAEKGGWKLFPSVSREDRPAGEIVEILTNMGWLIEPIDRRRTTVIPPAHYTRDKFVEHFVADLYRGAALKGWE